MEQKRGPREWREQCATTSSLPHHSLTFKVLQTPLSYSGQQMRRPPLPQLQRLTRYKPGARMSSTALLPATSLAIILFFFVHSPWVLETQYMIRANFIDYFINFNIGAGRIAKVSLANSSVAIARIYEKSDGMCT